MPKKRDHGSGGLYYIPSRGLWRGVVDLEPDPITGKRRQKYVHAKTQRAAKEKLEEVQQEIREHGSPLDKTTTVADWARTWIDDVKKPHVDPKTLASYQGSVNHIISGLGRKRVSALKPSDVRDLREHVIGKGLSTSSARQAHMVLRMMLDDAVSERLAPRNVAQDVKLPSRSVVERGAIPTPQALAILRTAAAMENSAGSRWWFKLLGGPRQGEILGATIDDLDLKAGLYRVNWKLEELAREHGCPADDPCGFSRGAACPQARWKIPDGFEKRQISGRLHLTRPKSKTGRVVPLIPQLVEAIRRWLDATSDWPNPHGLIWRKEDGSPVLPSEDAQEWRDLLLAAGVLDETQTAPGASTITGHWARHTTVTVLASLGVDFQVIGEIVGHSSAQVTEIYRHTQAAEKMAAMEALGNVWSKAIGPAPKKGKKKAAKRSAASAAAPAPPAAD